MSPLTEPDWRFSLILLFRSISSTFESPGTKRSKSNKTPDDIKKKAVLALLNMGIVGKKRISRVANVTDQGLAVFAGLGKMPDPSFLHDFLV